MPEAHLQDRFAFRPAERDGAAGRPARLQGRERRAGKFASLEDAIVVRLRFSRATPRRIHLQALNL
jgi:hypothetical protein